MIIRGLLICICGLASTSASAGILFTPHPFEYSRLLPGQYVETTLFHTRIEEVFDREGEKITLGAPNVEPGENVDFNVALLKYAWIGNAFRNTNIPILKDHNQFCRVIFSAGYQQASEGVVEASRSFDMTSGGSGIGDALGLCGIYGDEYRWGPLKFNGLLINHVKVPVGNYDEDALLNLGTNYWTYVWQQALHAELYGRLIFDGTLAYQWNGSNSTPAFGGLTPTRPADVWNAEFDLTWKFNEHWQADIGYSYRSTAGSNYYDKVTIKPKDQPLPASAVCGDLVPASICNSSEPFFVAPRPGSYADRGVSAGLLMLGASYFYRASMSIQFRVLMPLKGRGSQIDVPYDVFFSEFDEDGNPQQGDPANAEIPTTLTGVQEAASSPASPFFELRLVFFPWQM